MGEKTLTRAEVRPGEGVMRIIKRNPAILNGGARFLILAGMANAASAQQVEDQQIQEIVVTAQKQVQDVQAISATVTAISDADLQRRGIDDVRQLATLVPGLNFNSEGADGGEIYLRGVGAASLATGTPQSIVVNLDSVSLYRFVIGSAAYDLSRVEVLYGPQGTLYGSNSSGGVVNMVTNRPTNDFGGYTTVEAGNYATLHTTGALNVPLADDFKVRVAWDSTQHDGYVSSGQPGDPGVDGENNVAARISALWTPLDALTIYAKADYWHAGGEGTIYVSAPFVNPSNPW